MRNLKKKGFTIVELVVVVAVIAILAAVLIPTVSGIIRKANISADIAVAKNLNNAAIAADANTFDEAIDAVQEAGYYVANLNAKASDCYFVWDDVLHQFILYDLKNDKILYANIDVVNEPDKDWCFAVKNSTVANAVKAVLPNVTIKITAPTMTDLKATIEAGGETTIYVDQSVVVDSKNAVVINDANAKITLDLGNSTISGNNSDGFSIENIPFQVTAGEITLKGGVVAATGTMLDADNKPMQNVVNVQNATVKLDGTKIAAPNATIPVALEGATATIKDTTIVAHDNAIQPSNGSIVTIENTTVECAWLAVYSSSAGGTASEVTIKSGNFSAKKDSSGDGGTNILGVYGGTIIVEGGNFSTENTAKTLKFYNVDGGKIVIKGGTFNDIAFANLTEDIIRGMCNLTDCAKGVDVTKGADGAWTIAVK